MIHNRIRTMKIRHCVGFCLLLPSQVITESQDYDITIITAY
jgi:hypothetical protein